MASSVLSDLVRGGPISETRNVAEQLDHRVDTSDDQLLTCAETCDDTANCCRRLAI
jgi:hypothetical protein